MPLLQCPKEAIMLASFSVVPMGAGEGIKEIVAEALTIVDGSGLSYQLGPMHTVIEGTPEQVLDVILSCHRRVLELAPRVLDRKSTRLNSSHLGISYAVFCLK